MIIEKKKTFEAQRSKILEVSKFHIEKLCMKILIICIKEMIKNDK
jgi:hypothetical protein